MALFKICLFLCFVISHIYGATLDKIETSVPPTEICVRSTPCGWAIYHRYSRDIDYFMKNKCECPEGKKCIRTDDDISVTAYVYRCKD